MEKVDSKAKILFALKIYDTKEKFFSPFESFLSTLIFLCIWLLPLIFIKDIGVYVYTGIVLFSMFSVFLIIGSLFHSSYRYELREDFFYKKQGIISKVEVSIPYNKIQNVDIMRPFIYRILGVSEISIQTAGMGSKTGEGRILGLSRKKAEELRDELMSRSKVFDR